MKRTICMLAVVIGLTAGSVLGAAQQELEAAARSGKVAFILIYDATAAQVDIARLTVADAVRRVPGAVIVDLDRGNAANAEFVAKYKLGTAPVPLILVASSSGVITGGLVAAQATTEALVKLVPSPKQAEIVKAISEGNAVFITASRRSMASTATVNSICAAACQQMAGKSVQINIDMDDPAEAGFLTSLKVNMQSTEPVTLVANPQGQIAQTYTGAVQVTDLVTAATKKVGGCCPSTASNPNASCAPTTKK